MLYTICCIHMGKWSNKPSCLCRSLINTPINIWRITYCRKLHPTEKSSSLHLYWIEHIQCSGCHRLTYATPGSCTSRNTFISGGFVKYYIRNLKFRVFKTWLYLSTYRNILSYWKPKLQKKCIFTAWRTSIISARYSLSVKDVKLSSF
jgi:hypothetical protein